MTNVANKTTRTIKRSAITLCAAGAMFIASTGFAQSSTTTTDSRDYQTQSQRDGQDWKSQSRMSDECRELFQKLEGSWKVTMTMSSTNNNRPETNRALGSDADDRNADRNEKAMQKTGYATRTFALENHVLIERVQFGENSGMNSSGNTRTQDRTTDRLRDSARDIEDQDRDMDRDLDDDDTIRDRNETELNRNRNVNVNSQDSDRNWSESSDSYQGLGLFGFDPNTKEYNHVWTDTQNGGMVLSIGEFDKSAKTLKFHEHFGEMNHDKENRDKVNTASQSQQDSEPVVTLKIISDDKHVVTMTSKDSAGQSTEYTITYERSGASNSMREGTNRDRDNDRWQDDREDRMNNESGNTTGSMSDAKKIDEITTMFERSLGSAEIDSNRYPNVARQWAQVIVREHSNASTEELREAIIESLTTVGVKESTATTRANALAGEIHELLNR